LEEIERAQISQQFKLDRTGIDLLSLNFDVVINGLITALLPVIKHVPEFDVRSNCELSLMSAYVVGYQHDKPSHHPVHVDDCDITLNLNLGKTFTGGDLFFLDPDTKQIIGSTPHNVGSVIIHSGDLPHGAKQLNSGERYNLIIWLKKQYSFEQFSMLPQELQRYALNFFSVRQLCRLSQTNKAMKAMIYQADSTWSQFVSHDDSEGIETFNRQDVIERYRQGSYSDKKLIMILKEIIDTERMYFKSIKHGLVHGLQPLFEEFGSSDVKTDTSILTDMQRIVECHEALVSEIDDCIVDLNKNNEVNAINLLNIFELLFRRYDSYAQYVRKYDNFQSLLRHYETNKHVKKFLTEFRALPESNGIDLASYIIMPVRRVPRYTLLFKEMHKYTGSLTNGNDVAEMAQQVVNGMGMISKLLSAPIAMQQGVQVKPDQKDEDDDKKHKRCTVS
jgi:hypothetical protein